MGTTRIDVPQAMAVSLTVAQLRELIADAMTDVRAELEPREQPRALIDTAGLCRELDVSRPTITRLLGEGLPHVVLGDHRRFRLAVVIEWLETRDAQRGAA